jgi:uncharacterized protein (DUF1800 family)
MRAGQILLSNNVLLWVSLFTWPLVLGITSRIAAQQGPDTSYSSKTSTSLLAAGRILDQASFGPTTNDILHVEQVGVAGYVNEQLQMPATLMPKTVPAGTFGIADCSSFWTCYPEAWWWQNALWAPDQLRERVAFALSKLFVVSENGVDGRYMPAYFNTLSKDSFGNWYQLMTDITYQPAMGTYLNSANSSAAINGGHADENFGREFMQLFSIGTVALNQDGSPRLDANGNPIPNYAPAIVQNFARAYTGLTFAQDDCSTPTSQNFYWWPNPPGQGCAMVPLDYLHDTNAKILLRGQTLPAGQDTKADIAGALQNVFKDPSLPPFVCRRLIQYLVKSNPSPQYISRVAAVFINDGKGTRGNMSAVIPAILLDSEARADDAGGVPDENTGKLKEPILWWAAVLRATQATSGTKLPYVGLYRGVFDLWLADLGESHHQPASVFSYFSPNNTLNNSTLFAPEFQIENTNSISLMAEHAQDMIDNHWDWTPANEMNLDLSASSFLGQVAASQGPGNLVDLLNALLMHGAMTSEMKSTIVNAITGLDAATMTRNAVYLIVTSPEYRVAI